MEDKLLNFKTIILTHVDFDGLAALSNIYNIIYNPEKNFQYYAVGYHSIDKTLQKIKKDKFDILFILDLNLTKEQFDVINTYTGYKRIVHIDHHDYEFNVKEYTTKIQLLDYIFIHDESISASLATNNFIKDNWSNAHKKCKEFSMLGDIYDMWRTDHPRWNEAYAINDLFWEYGYEKFFKEFKNDYKITKEHKADILRIHLERNEYTADTIKNRIQFNEEFKIAYVINPLCKHTNHITLVYPAMFYVILKQIKEDSLAYSIRIYDPEFGLTLVEVFDILKKVGIKINTSGGHKKVGGVEIPLDENEKFLETINSIFERKLT